MGAYDHSLVRYLILGGKSTTLVRTRPVPNLLFH